MNLTEQHRSGKLERNRDYFVKVNDKVVSIYLDGDNDFIYYGHIIKPEVLAAVPTYEEYQALLSDQLAKNEGVEINAELKAKNRRLKFDVEALRRDYVSIMKHNRKILNDIETLAQTLLIVSPEHRFWLEKNYKEYL